MINDNEHDNWHSLTNEQLEPVDEYGEDFKRDFYRVADALKWDKDKPPIKDNSQRPAEFIRKIIYDHDAEYEIDSTAKTTDALLLRGRRAFLKRLDDMEMDELRQRIRMFRKSDVAACYDRVSINESVDADINIKTPGLRYQEGVSRIGKSNRNKKVHYHEIEDIKEVLKILDAIGLDASKGIEFLVLCAIEGTTYAKEIGAQDRIKRIVDSVMDGIKDIIHA
ncbi:hypothetical protein Mpsy_0321 [Methanolobus psychrophilus R15]|nr:hypothetical protein Mpsy_0321 [Methanolobus psychrophilus R15]